MKIFKATLSLVLAMLMVVSLTACLNTTMTLEEYYEKNKVIYDNLSETTEDGNSLVYSVRDNSLVLTATISIEVDDDSLETYRSALQQSIETSEDDYLEVLENVQEDVPDATFIVEFVDKNGKLLYSKEYK